MNYELLMEKIVPSFDELKLNLIKDLYDNLVQLEGKQSLSFFKV